MIVRQNQFDALFFHYNAEDRHLGSDTAKHLYVGANLRESGK